MDDLNAPSGRFESLLPQPDGSITHLGARQILQEAIYDADTRGSQLDAQVTALRPRRVVASREAGSAWLKT